MTLFFCSCAIPVPTVKMKVTSPYIRGRVIDCESGLSVYHAKVRFEGREFDFVFTDNDGKFFMEKQKDLVLLHVYTPCPVYDFPTPRKHPGALIVTLEGYKELKLPLKPYYDERNQKMLERAKRGENVDYSKERDKLEILLNDICIEQNG